MTLGRSARRTRLGGPPSWGRADPLDDPWESRRPGRSLPEVAVAALIIYHDLLAFSSQDDSNFTTLLTRANLYVDWAVTEWQPRLVRFEWPEPPVATFFQYDLFKTVWSKAVVPKNVTTTPQPEKQIERLAFAWLSAGTAVVANESAIIVPDPGKEMPWPDLHEQLKIVTQNADNTTLPGSDNCSEWLLRIAELLMPEMGLPGSIAREFSNFGKPRGFWAKNRPDIQQRRAERLAELNSVEPKLADRLLASERSMAHELAPEVDAIKRLSERYDRGYGSSRDRMERE